MWRSKAITGPYEGPRIVLKSNVEAACVNSGTVVLGPDNVTWYYLYDAIQPSRWNMQRQMFVDKITWTEDRWPQPRTPGGRNKYPKGGTSVAERWHPELNDDFDGSLLEGVTGGVLGRKWLFKEENETLWELTGGSLSLRTDCVGIESMYPANMLLQRPTAAYYRIETQLQWPTTPKGGLSCDGLQGSSAGLIARELNTGKGVAVGLVCNSSTSTVQIAAWQDTLYLLHAVPLPSESIRAAYLEIRLRIDVELVLAQVWYSVADGPWTAVPAFNDKVHGSEMTFEYVSTLMWWQAVGPDSAAWKHEFKNSPTDAFTTLHPGLFAGGGDGRAHSVLFDYFRFDDNEDFPVDEL